MQSNESTNLVIVGGGAGGLILARRLASSKHFTREFSKGLSNGSSQESSQDKPLNIILVDQALTHVWKPLLHEVAAGTLDSYENEIPYFAHASHYGYEFIHGHITHISPEDKQITLKEIIDDRGVTIRSAQTIQYHLLVLAMGSICNDFNIPGVKDYCYLLDSRQEAEKLNRNLVSHFTSLRFEQKITAQEPLRITIIGGGATGVELASELISTLGYLEKIKSLSQISQRVKVQLVEASASLLNGQDPKSIQYAKNAMKALGVEVFTNTKVIQVGLDAIEIQNAKPLKSDIHVWATGIKAPAVLNTIQGLALNSIGQIKVDAQLRAFESSIFALGDCAEVIINEKRLGPRAQVAQQQALYLAKSIPLILQGQTPAAFIFNEKGSFVSLGEHLAAGYVQYSKKNAFHMKGLLARLTYAMLYRKHQIEILGWRKGISAILKHYVNRSTKNRVKIH